MTDDVVPLRCTATLPHAMSTPENAPRFSFTSAEWLLIFPRAAPTAGRHFTDSLLPAEEGNGKAALSSVDPASELREQFPLDRKAMDHTFDRLNARELAVQFRITEVFLPLAIWGGPGPILCSTFWNLSNVALVATIWVLDTDSLFESRQLIAGALALGFVSLCIWLTLAISMVMGRRSGFHREPQKTMIAPMESLIRWQQLVDGDLVMKIEPAQASQNSDETADCRIQESALLAHEPNDRLCPCPECLRTLPNAICWDRILRAGTLHLYFTFAFWTSGWTPMIHYAPTYWLQPWGIILGVVFASSIVATNWIAVIDKWLHPTIPLLKLAEQIYHRATSLALSSFLERAKMDLRYPSPQGVLDGVDNSELEVFVRLHAGYMTRWQTQSVGDVAFTCLAVTLLPTAVILAIIINLVSFVSWN